MNTKPKAQLDPKTGKHVKRPATLFARVQKTNHAFVMKNFKQAGTSSASEFVDLILTQHRLYDKRAKVFNSLSL